MTFDLLFRMQVLATALLGLALLLDLALRRRWVLGTAAMWNAMLVALVALPAASLLAPRWQIDLLPAQWQTADGPAAAQIVIPPTPAAKQIVDQPAAEFAPPEPLPEAVPAAVPIQQPAPIAKDVAILAPETIAPSRVWNTLTWIYGLGALIALIRLATSWLSVKRLRESAQPVSEGAWAQRLAHWLGRLPLESGISRQVASAGAKEERLSAIVVGQTFLSAVKSRKLPADRNVCPTTVHNKGREPEELNSTIRLLQSDKVPVPVALGVRDPVIVVPSQLLQGIDEKKIDAILIHELAHVARADCAWQLLQRFLECALWFHPLYWFAQKRIAFIRERACDDFAIHALGDKSAYSETLLEMVARKMPGRSLALGMAVVRSGSIEQRLEAIDQSNGAARCLPSRKMRWVLMGLSVVALIILANLNIGRAKEDEVKAQELFTIRSQKGGIHSVVYSPDGKLIATASGTTVKLWDADTGKEILAIKDHKRNVFDVAFSADGKLLAAGGDTKPKIWDVATGLEVLTLDGEGAGNVIGVAYSPDGKLLASASTDETVTLWDAGNGKEIRKLQGHLAPLKSVAFSPDGKWVASASHGNMVIAWEVATGKEMYTFAGEGVMMPETAIFSPDSKWPATGVFDNTLLQSVIRFWDMATGKEIHLIKSTQEETSFNCLTFSPDGKRIASGSSTVNLWDFATGRNLLTLKGHTNGISSVAFSPDGKRLASASYDGTVKVWSLTSRQDAQVRPKADALALPQNQNAKSDPVDDVQPPVFPQYVRTLSTGESVELFGVSSFPLKETSWHRPDGVPLARWRNAPNFGINDAAIANKKEILHAFAIRVNNGFAGEKDEARWEIQPKPGVRSGSSRDSMSSSSDKTRTVFLHHASFPDQTQQVDIKFGIAAGPWQDILPDLAEMDRKDDIGHMGGYLANFEARTSKITKSGHSFFLRGAEDTAKGLQAIVVITTPDDELTQQIRLVAVKKDGSRMAESDESRSAFSNFDKGRTHLFVKSYAGLAYKDLKGFRFEARPFEWVEFKDVRLQPVQAKAEPPPAAKKAEKLEAKSDVAKRYLSQTRFRQSPDGTFPAASLENIRKEIERQLVKESGWKDAGAARNWLERTAKQQSWSEAALIALLDEAAGWSVSVVNWSAEMEADNDFVRPGMAPDKDFLAKLSFGPAGENGLRAAYLLDPLKESYALGEIVKCHVIFLNAGQAPIQLATDRWRQDDRLTVLDATGNAVKAPGVRHTGWATYSRFLLKPGEVAQSEAPAFAIGEGDYEEEHSLGTIQRVIAAKSGETLRLSWSMKVPGPWTRGGSKQTFPAPGDWVGNLQSGEVSFKVVASDPNAKPPLAVASQSGNYRITDKIRLQVSDMTHPDKHTNEADIVWLTEQAKGSTPANKFHITLPDGYATFAILWQRGGTMMWVLDKESLRKINFANPQNVTQESIPVDRINAVEGLPVEVREELKRLKELQK